MKGYNMAPQTIHLRPKGQMTLPADIREKLGLNEGDRLHIELKDRSIIISRPADIIDRTAGALKRYTKNSPKLTLEEIDRIAAHGIAEGGMSTIREIEEDYISK